MVNEWRKEFPLWFRSFILPPCHPLAFQLLILGSAIALFIVANFLIYLTVYIIVEPSYREVPPPSLVGWILVFSVAFISILAWFTRIRWVRLTLNWLRPFLKIFAAFIVLVLLVGALIGSGGEELGLVIVDPLVEVLDSFIGPALLGIGALTLIVPLWRIRVWSVAIVGFALVGFGILMTYFASDSLYDYLYHDMLVRLRPLM